MLDYVVRRAEDGDWIATSASLPWCATVGRSRDEAVASLEDVIRLVHRRPDLNEALEPATAAIGTRR
jgi:predicted RNase H-like HicB family nuclease